jgi:VanZ family protein
VIFFFSSQPAHESASLSGGVLQMLTTLTGGLIPASFFAQSLAHTLIRKTAHFLNNTVLGVLATRAARRPVWSRLLAFGLMAAVFDELHQLFVPGRSCELRDVLIDLGGFALGCLLSRLAVRQGRKVQAADRLPVKS